MESWSKQKGPELVRTTGSIQISVFRFVSSKNESLFLQRKNPRKIAWTVAYRRLHKKGVTEEVAKKRSRKTVKHQRGIVGASLEQINARRNQKPEVRAAARQAAVAKSKEDKKAKAEVRKANKVKSLGAGGAGPQVSRQQMKGGAGKHYLRGSTPQRLRITFLLTFWSRPANQRRCPNRSTRYTDQLHQKVVLRFQAVTRRKFAFSLLFP
ncbi:60S ribosomal protein L24 [Pseudozyma hubeiensis SY62]|uniref:60S ribosomal protein L24 n=1 Tax=Pseudozyma hubeiensis (strain SY62) TaxID=1305764 RepID=R9P7Z3_PSEHS|nr:60S ribosomal protein L24 [Pseudozyma hubeiensis SY62]GAC97347.1 60S ribosomal protein L24 [Pseudozyma hubeiensis SY62]